MNWTTILTNEARSNCVLRLEELSRKYNRSEPVVRNSLGRYEQKGLVERVSSKLYINHLNQQFSPQDLVNNIRPKSYISLESALVEKGIINQSPTAFTCVSPAHSHRGTRKGTSRLDLFESPGRIAHTARRIPTKFSIHSETQKVCGPISTHSSGHGKRSPTRTCLPVRHR